MDVIIHRDLRTGACRLIKRRKKCSYAYNEDWLRTQKTYNGTTTDYYYNGSVLICIQTGNTVQRFSYDAQGMVV